MTYLPSKLQMPPILNSDGTAIRRLYTLSNNSLATSGGRVNCNDGVWRKVGQFQITDTFMFSGGAESGTNV